MDIRHAVRQFITSNFFVPEGTPLTDDDLLLEHGVVDSTGVLEVVSFIEEEYRFKLGDDEIVPENLGSISSIVAFVSRKTGDPQASAPHGLRETS
jgi:acyl carrier protein